MLAPGSSAVASSAAGRKDGVPVLPWKEIVRPVEPFLEAVGRGLDEQVQAFDPAVASYAAYALNARGKQLRPALVALSGAAVGRLEESHVLAAVIVEMIHLATLVHDDVIDEGEIRRGRPTLAANWGNEIAVLAGDCLFAQALRLAASYPTPEICRVVSAATNTVCSGEILQMRSRRDYGLSRTDYFKVLQMKTGELFGLSCSLGAYLGGADAAGCSSVRGYGLAVGTAYQVFDDCVDLFGSEVVAGKSLGTDLAKGKLTLPVLLLLERAEGRDRARACGLIEHWQAEHVSEMMKLLQAYHTLGASRQILWRWLGMARRALQGVQESESKACLLGLTGHLGRLADRLEYAG